MNYRALHWWSDWNGYEVGYPEIDVVGLYCLRDFPEIQIYIDAAEGRILEVWLEDDE